MKKNDFVKIIREIVRQELKKELPNAISKVFQNLGSNSTQRKTSTSETDTHSKSNNQENQDKMINLKHQLKEMFQEESDIPTENSVSKSKVFTKNPLLNEVLNQTKPFNSTERFALRAGGGGGLASVSPAVMMTSQDFQMNSTSNFEEQIDENEYGFVKNIPQLPIENSISTKTSPSTPSTPITLPENISALDVKNHPAIPENIRNILKRDYRDLVKAMDKKK